MCKSCTPPTGARNVTDALRSSPSRFGCWSFGGWPSSLQDFFSTRHGVDFTATNMDHGNPPPPRSTLQAVQTGTASASAVQSTVADANVPVVAHVAMKNMKFSPATIEIKKGDTVEWTNEDITPHTATSTPFFDSGSIASDQSWRHTFTEPGDFPYACTFHPDMKADVIVK